MLKNLEANVVYDRDGQPKTEKDKKLWETVKALRWVMRED